jgi:hypothetical protein
VFINATKRELGIYKALQRKLRANYDVLMFEMFCYHFQFFDRNKEDLSQRTIEQCSVLVLGASRDKFSKKEVSVDCCVFIVILLHLS